MIRSDETNKLFEAFSRFQGAMEVLKKDKKVTVKSEKASYSYKYSPLDNLVEAAKKPLSDNGLGVTQLLGTGKLTTLLTHSSGQFIGEETTLPFNSPDIQKFGSQLTYVRRYAYGAILGLAPEEDDDGNVATGNNFEKDEGSKKSATPPASKPAAPKQPEGPILASDAQRKKIFATAKDLGHESETAKGIVKEFFKLESFTELTSEQANKAIDSLEKKLAEKRKKEGENFDLPPEEVSGNA